MHKVCYDAFMEQHVLALKTLGHSERLRILALISRGELTVSELVQILQLSQPRVTQYIISLETAGIIAVSYTHLTLPTIYSV